MRLQLGRGLWCRDGVEREKKIGESYTRELLIIKETIVCVCVCTCVYVCEREGEGVQGGKVILSSQRLVSLRLAGLSYISLR